MYLLNVCPVTQPFSFSVVVNGAIELGVNNLIFLEIYYSSKPFL